MINKNNIFRNRFFIFFIFLTKFLHKFHIDFLSFFSIFFVPESIIRIRVKDKKITKQLVCYTKLYASILIVSKTKISYQNCVLLFALMMILVLQSMPFNWQKHYLHYAVYLQISCVGNMVLLSRRPIKQQKVRSCKICASNCFFQRNRPSFQIAVIILVKMFWKFLIF